MGLDDPGQTPYNPMAQAPSMGVLPPSDPVAAAAQLPLMNATAGANMPMGAQLPLQASQTPQAATTGQPVQQTPGMTGPMSSSDPLMQLYQHNIQQGQESVQRLRGLGSQEADVPIAQRWAPKFQHGGGGGGFLHNLGQALMAVGAATRPGQNIVNSMYARDMQKRTQEIEGIKAQEQPEQEALKFEEGVAQGAGGLAYKQGMLGVRQEQADTQAKREQDYAQYVQDQAKYHADSIDVRKFANNEKGRHDLVTEIQAKANEAGRNYRAMHHDATTVEVAGIVSNTQTAIKDALIANNPSILGWLKGDVFGIPTPQVPTATPPTYKETHEAPPSRPDASGAAPPKGAKGATPARPKPVPNSYIWNPKDRTWDPPRGPGGR